MRLFEIFLTAWICTRPSRRVKLIKMTGLAANISSEWRNDSTTVVLLSDGDTVPLLVSQNAGNSVNGILVIGVGNPQKERFLMEELQTRRFNFTTNSIAT